MTSVYDLAECRLILNRNGHEQWTIAPDRNNPSSLAVRNLQDNLVLTVAKEKDAYTGVIMTCDRTGYQDGQTCSRPGPALQDALNWIRQNPDRHRPDELPQHLRPPDEPDPIPFEKKALLRLHEDVTRLRRQGILQGGNGPWNLKPVARMPGALARFLAER